MRDILAAGNLATLTAFASSSVLVGFDYDGTLAPIACTPQRARMRRATRRLLAQVAQRYPCVVISGRARNDLARRLERLPLWNVIGNHGREPWAQDADIAAAVQVWVQHLRRCLAFVPGLVIEDKRYSVTIHYRRSRDKPRVRRTIVRAVHGLANVRTLEGDQAVNLVFSDGIDKGVALQRVRRAVACDTAIYVGDDETDEDAFTSAPRDQLLAIRVGHAKGSRAHYRVKSQADIDRLLERLIAVRTTRPSAISHRRR